MMREHMKKLLVLAVLALVLGAVPVFAAGDNFQVEVNVVPSCVFTLTNDINFGNLDVTSFGTKTGLGSVTILCTSGQLYQVALDNGQQPDGSGGRQMSDGGIDVLPYELYQEAWPTTKIWKSGTDAMAYNATGNRDTFTVYGVLSWLESMLPTTPVGTYLDMVTATYSW